MANNNGRELSSEVEDLNDGWGQSLYNDEKGMKFTVLFTPLQPFDPKRRRNAKPTTITKIVYVHEDMSTKDMIIKLYAGSRLEGSDSLTFTYTVYRSQNKDVSLDNEDDYLELCTQVQSARKAEVTLKLAEQKVVTGDNLTEDEQDDDKENENPRKKRKQHVPSTEEIAQDQHIVQLQSTSISPTNTFELGQLQWHEEADTLGVDIEHPLNSKIFDPTDHGRNHNNQSNITVNFAGLAELIRLSSPSKNPTRSTKTMSIPPKLDLQSFATWFGLSGQLHDKLKAIHLDGPHLLRLVSNEQLRTEGGLSLGELAVLRDAEERWKEGHEL
ncbi:uncharacterized protein F5147DRAFT_651357 [Suillus discolor]|uniref:Uncharacterized protein n=1 Tax=Suillus discolor TaxID=1912936 RepID=A0A9P7F940_9AGAM|nr:uncharacterized protein F5147DRAFT_651357 [Suillus discolor]KAG2111135.1 hypothetical protein F5147DRAFT_651357 [Suillus discolor]